MKQEMPREINAIEQIDYVYKADRFWTPIEDKSFSLDTAYIRKDLHQKLIEAAEKMEQALSMMLSAASASRWPIEAGHMVPMNSARSALQSYRETQEMK